MNSPETNTSLENQQPETKMPQRTTHLILKVMLVLIALIFIGVVTVLASKHKANKDVVSTTDTPNPLVTYVGEDSTVSYQLPSGYTAYQCDDLQALYIYNSNVSPLTGKTTARCAYILPDSVLTSEKPDISASTDVKSAQLDRVTLQAFTILSVDKVSPLNPAITKDVATTKVASKYQEVPASVLTITDNTIGGNHVFNGCIPTQFQIALTKGEPICTLYFGDQNTTITMNSMSQITPLFSQFIESIHLNAKAGQ